MPGAQQRAHGLTQRPLGFLAPYAFDIHDRDAAMQVQCHLILRRCHSCDLPFDRYAEYIHYRRNSVETTAKSTCFSPLPLFNLTHSNRPLFLRSRTSRTNLNVFIQTPPSPVSMSQLAGVRYIADNDIETKVPKTHGRDATRMFHKMPQPCIFPATSLSRWCQTRV